MTLNPEKTKISNFIFLYENCEFFLNLKIDYRCNSKANTRF